MTYASTDDFLSGGDDFPAEDLELSRGRTVKIRGLSRYELLLNGKGTEEGDVGLIERRNVHVCLMNPRMTLQQVEAWQRRPDSGADFAAMSNAIRRLSNLGQGADKSGVDEVSDGA